MTIFISLTCASFQTANRQLTIEFLLRSVGFAIDFKHVITVIYCLNDRNYTFLLPTLTNFKLFGFCVRKPPCNSNE